MLSFSLNSFFPSFFLLGFSFFLHVKYTFDLF